MAAVFTCAVVLSAAVDAQPVSLRPLADAAEVWFAAAVDAETLGDDAAVGLLVDNVNMVSTRTELAMAVVQPEPGVFDFSRAEEVVDFAVEHDMVVRGHELIGQGVPAWVAGGTWTAETLGQVLREHVATVIGHFRDRNPGVVVQWDVVGEAFLPDGTPRPTIWQQVIGDDHLRIAFEAAREADPDAALFYDDFFDDAAVTQDAVASGVSVVPGSSAEFDSCDVVAKCVGVRDRIAALVTAGVPIDGVGFQSHVFSPDPADLAGFSSWVGELGLQWAITEFDVPLPITEIANAESLEFQATVFADALAACADAPDCDTFVSWGVTDRFSPIPAETGGAFGGALWFDQADVAKPAFDAMAEVLTERGPTPTTVPATTATSAPATTVRSPEVDVSGSSSTGPWPALVAAVGSLAAIGVVIVILRRRRRHLLDHDPVDTTVR